MLPFQFEQCQGSVGGEDGTKGVQLNGHSVALHCLLILTFLEQIVTLATI